MRWLFICASYTASAVSLCMRFSTQGHTNSRWRRRLKSPLCAIVTTALHCIFVREDFKHLRNRKWGQLLIFGCTWCRPQDGPHVHIPQHPRYGFLSSLLSQLLMLVKVKRNESFSVGDDYIYLRLAPALQEGWGPRPLGTIIFFREMRGTLYMA